MKASAYNLCARDSKGTYYLFNTRRGAVHVMTARLYEAYWAAVNDASSPAGADATARALTDKGFLVDDDVDELSEIKSAHQNARANPERLELLIAPSMACNLDCFYCFEANRYSGQMGTAAQSDVVQFVSEYFDSGTRHLDVTWYGGEPLLAFSVIERLSAQFLVLCEKSGREYSAGIVTNATLMTDIIAQKLASWHVKRAQITLDGTPELHDARRIPKSRRPTFYRIVEGIEAAAAHMHVSVRINVCREVAMHLEELLQILAARGLNRLVSVYMAPLQLVQHRNVPSRGKPVDALNGRETGDLELRFNDLLSKYDFAVSNRLPEPRCTTCMADREHSWLIEANGDVQKCYWTAGVRAEAVGRLTHNGIIVRDPDRKWRNWSVFENSECAHCIMLPLCLGRCPLKHLNHETDYCPPFRHNWVGVLARVAGVPEDQLAPVQLPLVAPG